MSLRHTTALKNLISARAAAILPGAANALAARVIEDLGFDAAYVTGAGIANSYLGVPDIGLLTLKELVDHVAAIRGAVELPLLVDADTGFGNALNTAKTLRQLERAGASGIQLEDQTFPKRCGHFAGKEVIVAAEMAGKIKAAVDARDDADFFIVARTDAAAVEGLEAALERAQIYAEAGADATFVEAPRSQDELARIAAELAPPQIANMVFGGQTPLLDQAGLERLGYGAVLYANAALQASLQGMQQVLGELKSTGRLDGVADGMVDFAERQRLVAKESYDTAETRYAPAANPNQEP